MLKSLLLIVINFSAQRIATFVNSYTERFYINAELPSGILKVITFKQIQ